MTDGLRLTVDGISHNYGGMQVLRDKIGRAHV